MRPNREVVLGEVVLLEDVLRAPTLKALLLLSPHVLRTDHADRVRLGTDDHNYRLIMKTLAKVGVTSNSLWWAINGGSLLFAAGNAAQRCARTHIQT